MPRKNITPAVKTRVRDNQRRSRARRRELVEDMQRRLHEYERRGAQATADMQQAARAVAVENERLRALLACHGVTENEVERFLRFGDGGVEWRPLEGSGSDDIDSLAAASSAGSDECADGRRRSCHDGGGGGDGSSTNVPMGQAPGSRAGTPVLEIGHTFNPENPVPSSLETSCEAAARILADMQGHGDTSSAFAALGCPPTRSCVVRNIDVLNLIDLIS